MTEWIKHDGGPQPVADDVWVEVELRNGRCIDHVRAGSLGPVSRAWPVDIVRYRIFNQHLIDAARLEGIREGRDAAFRALIQQFEITLPAVPEWHRLGTAISALNPETIAKEAAR
jgi:hypothetical protein